MWSEFKVSDADQQFLMLTAGSDVKMTFIHSLLQPTVEWSEFMILDANQLFLILTAGTSVEPQFQAA